MDELKYGDDLDPRRASVASRRTCASTHSGPFFPNVSRSPRDLTSLAAKFHSPKSSNIQQRLQRSEARQVIRYDVGDSAAQIDGASHSALADWQLPLLSFRPLSIGQNKAAPHVRPKTSGEITTRSGTEIFSPTPERPMSSQSRKRFSKILDLEDGSGWTGLSSCLLSRSYHSMTSSALKTLGDLPEGIDSPTPLIASTESFLSREQDASEDNIMDIVGAYADTRSSQNTYNEKSTIDSLLDKHIECLGLQPETEADVTETSSLTEKTSHTTISQRTIRGAPAVCSTSFEKHRPCTSRSWRSPALPSTDRTLLPRRLFSSADKFQTKFPQTRSLTCISDLERDSWHYDRPSRGWQTLASSSQIASVSSVKPSLLSGELADVSSDDNARVFDFSDGMKTTGSPSSVSEASQARGLHNISHMIEPLYAFVRTDLARQASEHRKLRVRLKIKRESHSLGQLSNGLSVTSPGDSAPFFHNKSSQGTSIQPDTILTSAGNLPELSGDCVQRPALLPPVGRSDEKRISSPPRVPIRWSSILAFAHEPVKRSLEVTRKLSTKTAHSNRSNQNLADPINSTRLSSQIPRVESHVRLASPDFGPALASSDLCLTLPYAEPPSTIRPTLRETQSFFSDDSSAQKNRRTSFRKRFHLHSLRSTTVAGSRGVANAATQTSRSSHPTRLHQSCQALARKSSEHEMALDGTVAMSDFAYKRRKVVEKLKEWWKRRCLQKRLALMKLKGDKPGPGGLVI